MVTEEEKRDAYHASCIKNGLKVLSQDMAAANKDGLEIHLRVKSKYGNVEHVQWKEGYFFEVEITRTKTL